MRHQRRILAQPVPLNDVLLHLHDAATLGAHAEKRYTFEEWAELTRLIRFTGVERPEEAVAEEDEDVIEWDWLGENSPLMTHVSEPEFVLDRLCESLVRYTRRVEKRVERARKESWQRRGEGERPGSRRRRSSSRLDGAEKGS